MLSELAPERRILHERLAGGLLGLRDKATMRLLGPGIEDRIQNALRDLEQGKGITAAEYRRKRNLP